MYQLKIPCFTDGASDSHHRNPALPKPSLASYQPARTVSSLSHCSTATKTSQNYTATMASLAQNSPATAVVISKKPMDTHAPVCQSSTDSAPLGISHAELQGCQFEDKMLLVNDSLQSLAQDTFYVRTADLQIIMQLISDEQLALIEPKIETQDCNLHGGHSFPHQDSETSQPDTVQTSVSQEIHKHCSDHIVTQPCVSESDTNSSTFSKILDIIPLSSAATELQNSAESAKDAHGRHPENIYLTKTGPKGVISSSCSTTAHYVSAPPDSRANLLGQQCKLQKTGDCASLINSEQVRVSGSAGEKAAQELISQSTVKEGDGVPSGCHKWFSSLHPGHNDPSCGHSSSENVIQEEVPKETHVKNSAVQTPSRRSQLPEHKTDRTAELSISTEPCVTLAPSNTATCEAINNTPADPNSPCPNLNNSFATHSKLTRVSITHGNPTEPYASQCHLGGGYVDVEGASSSSDDEGKLVIELE
uniref:Uncharacterized protein n=1 Tax=Electrophorus electricus TaxID=8005 RepID=A0A4W4FQT0_ELEEL